MRTSSFLPAGLALAALLAGPIAHAGTGQVSAEITGLKLEVIDLLPDDGKTAQVTLFAPNYGMNSSFYDARGWEFGEDVLVHHKGSIQAVRPFGGTTALITADTTRSSVNIWSQEGQVDGGFTSWAEHAVNFALDYGAALKVTAFGTLAASNPGGVPQAANVRLKGSLMTNGASGPTDEFLHQIDLDQGTGTFELSGYLYSNSGNTGYVLLSTFAAMSAVAAPVPEPETYAMLLAGLGLLGWRARKLRS